MREKLKRKVMIIKNQNKKFLHRKQKSSKRMRGLGKSFNEKKLKEKGFEEKFD